MSAITINAEQRLFVIPHVGGFTCLGFDTCFKRLRQYAQLLGLAAPDEAQKGQIVQYEQYLQAERAYCATNPTATHYEPDTPAAVREILERYRRNGKQLRLFQGDTKTGRAWQEEFDVVGRISRSTGPLKVPLLVATGEDGGGAILTHCIVRILDVDTKRELYRHPTYSEPAYTTRQGQTKGYPVEVLADNELVARFKSAPQAQKWIDFMQGKRMSTR